MTYQVSRQVHDGSLLESCVAGVTVEGKHSSLPGIVCYEAMRSGVVAPSLHPSEEKWP